jgi:hypothetical protein
MARRRSKLDTEIQGLYGLPLQEFTAARNALAKRLKKEGSKDDAEEVTALPKPTVSAWAVNHLFTAEPDRMEELLAAGESARKALREILSGGDAGALREAIQEARDLANDLRDRAVEALSAEGNRPGPAIVERIATNLQSLAFSPVAEPVLERGWLDVDLPPVGFEVLAGLQLAAMPARPRREPPAKPAPAPRPKPAPARTEKKEKEEDKEETRLREKREREEAKARERREKEEEKSRERAGREEARRRERLARIQAQREEAAGRADFLRRKAEQAEKVAEEARQKAEETERLAADARKRADEADRELAKADKAVEAARG